MKIVIDIPEKQYKDIQRIAEVQLDRRTDSVEQIVAKGTPLEEIPNPCIECSQNCCVSDLNGEKCSCQKIYVLEEREEEK